MTKFSLVPLLHYYIKKKMSPIYWKVCQLYAISIIRLTFKLLIYGLFRLKKGVKISELIRSAPTLIQMITLWLWACCNLETLYWTELVPSPKITLSDDSTFSKSLLSLKPMTNCQKMEVNIHYRSSIVSSNSSTL